MANRTCVLAQDICTIWRVWWWYMALGLPVQYLIFGFCHLFIILKRHGVFEPWSFTIFGWNGEYVHLVASDRRSYSQSLVHCSRSTWFLTCPCLVWTECDILETGSASMFRWTVWSDGRSCSQSVLPFHTFNWWCELIPWQTCLFWNAKCTKSRSWFIVRLSVREVCTSFLISFKILI
jgi:hypothetical protein